MLHCSEGHGSSSSLSNSLEGKSSENSIFFSHFFDEYGILTMNLSSMAHYACFLAAPDTPAMQDHPIQHAETVVGDFQTSPILSYMRRFVRSAHQKARAPCRKLGKPANQEGVKGITRTLVVATRTAPASRASARPCESSIKYLYNAHVSIRNAKAEARKWPGL